VPDANISSSTIQLSSSTPGATVSPSSSDAEYDKLPVCMPASYTREFMLMISCGNQFTMFLKDYI
jgi:hypothetical protein